MTKEQAEAMDRKYHLYCKHEHKCQVCGKTMRYDEAQIAHRVPKTKALLKKYGPAVIHHPFNLRIVCGLKCNAAVLVNPGARPMEAQALIDEIKEELGI